jgi:hypothetical protein
MKNNQTATRAHSPVFGASSLLLVSGLLACTSGSAGTVEVSTFEITEVVENPGPPVAEDPVVASNVAVAPVVESPVVELPVAPREPGVIDLAIGLDTSGSMKGLLDSARQTIWAIVNDLALVEPAPILRVALLTFGNDGHTEENGWVNIDSAFTADLDAISEQLFALSTNGGTELVGRVVDAATKNLDWSTDPNALKLIVVAGNESANQDTVVSFRDACGSAISAGIMVNSIYCGNQADGLAPEWREISLLADGHFASIDQDNGMVIVATPFDDALASLTKSVNTTYIPWGDKGWIGHANQVAQDLNNFELNSEAGASRVLAKNSGLYVCGWDLVDAVRTQKLEMKDVDRSKLAEELRGLSDEDLKAHVDSMATQRAKIQKEIAEVNTEREDWLKAERERQNIDDSKAMDRVMRDAIRSQAGGKGFLFKVDAASQKVVQGDGC